MMWPPGTETNHVILPINEGGVREVLDQLSHCYPIAKALNYSEWQSLCEDIYVDDELNELIWERIGVIVEDWLELKTEIAYETEAS